MAKKRNHRDKFNPAGHGWLATYKIGKVITSKFNLEEVLSLISKVACTATASKAASVILIDNNSGDVSIGGSFGINKAVLQAGPLKFEKAIVSRLSSTKKPFLINDISKSPHHFDLTRALKKSGRGSVLCVQVIFNKRVLAAMVLYSGTPKAYTKDHIKISSALACQIALAIQNCNLYNSMHVNYFNTIRSLVLAMEAKDPYTKGHSERVTEYALTIASTMDLPPNQIHMIKYCGMLHDLGKIAVSDTILNKKGSLTPWEMSQVQRHPVEGAQVLSPLAFLRQGLSLVRHHHERFDGRGYPDSLKAERIPIAARILSCADAYDAMTSDRPYRSRLTKEQAISELKDNAGSQFDPQVVDVFLKSLEAR